MSVLSLVRHGQASFGSHDYDRLSPRGQQQVRRLEAHWNALGNDPTHLYSGPLRRQRQTAELLASRSKVAIIEDAAFKEFDASSVLAAYAAEARLTQSDVDLAVALERHDAQDHTDPARRSSIDRPHDPEELKRFQLGLEAATLAWVRGELQGDFESWPDFRHRVVNAVETLMNATGRGQQVAVCTSAGVIGTAMGHLMGLSDEGAIRLSWVLLNASVSTVLFDAKRRSVLRFNALPHLEQPEYRDLLTRI
jgi:broad specificity phosphatase PhoE